MKSHLRKNRRQRRGFTLMEVLVVMAILVVLASTVTFAYMNIMRGAESDNTFSQINLLKQACDKYKLDMNRYPANLGELIAPPNGASPRKWRGPYLDATEVPADAWGNPFEYAQDNSTNQVVISSWGPDGQKGTQDDIRSDQAY